MRTPFKLLLLPFVVAATLQSGSTAEDKDYSRYISPWKTPWNYQGPRGAKNWSALDPSYTTCNTGKEQSPIDIRNPHKADLPPLRFENKTEPIRYVINNGHTIRVNYHDAPGTGSLLLVGGTPYQLGQFHFHHPSEHYLNGKRYPMELHLMYKGPDGQIVGVAVLLKAGRADTTVQHIFAHMPPREGQVAVTGVAIDAAAMLPHNTSYYMYTGSLTAPPCTEGVKWIVMKTPGEVSVAQITAFARLFPDDARPLQPLNTRIVEEGR
jgi:carbonic anhydrase